MDYDELIQLRNELRARYPNIKEYIYALDFVAESAEYDCSYGDNCPDTNTKHGVCLGCKARRVLLLLRREKQ